MKEDGDLGTPAGCEDTDEEASDSTLNSRKAVLINPFEKHLLEQLNKPLWSPSVLCKKSAETPSQRSWAIDQISILNPSNIEESPSTHQNEDVLTPETEAKAQSAISKFFSQPMITTPDSPNMNSITECNHSIGNTQHQQSCFKMVNTDLSFPPTIAPDIENFLMTLSNQSLHDTGSAVNISLKRRKLDFTFSSTGTDDMETSRIDSPISGDIFHSPGLEDVEKVSPRQLRAGKMDSPIFTPIKVVRRK